MLNLSFPFPPTRNVVVDGQSDKRSFTERRNGKLGRFEGRDGTEFLPFDLHFPFMTSDTERAIDFFLPLFTDFKVGSSISFSIVDIISPHHSFRRMCGLILRNGLVFLQHLHNLHLRSKGMVLTNFSGTGVGFGFGIGCGFGVGWGFGGFPLHMLGLGVGGGCGVGLGLGWGFGAAFGSQYRTNKITFQGIDFNEKGRSDGKTIKD